MLNKNLIKRMFVTVGIVAGIMLGNANSNAIGIRGPMFKEIKTVMHEIDPTINCEILKYNVNAVLGKGGTIIHYLAKNGRHRELRHILNIFDADSSEECKLLLNSKDGDGRTPLILAILNEKEETVNVLVNNKNIDINGATDGGDTPLLVAVPRRNYFILSLLLHHPEIDVNKHNDDGHRLFATPLYFSMIFGNRHIRELLLDHDKIDVNKIHCNGRTMLHFAVRRDDLDMVTRLLDNGANVNIVDDLGHKPEVYATGKNATQIIRILNQSKDITIN